MRVELSGVVVVRGGHRVLPGVDLRLDGGVTVLLGPNGAGKSTLLQALVGLLPAQEGSVAFSGADGSAVPEAEVRQAIGYVPQDGTLPRGVRLDDLLRYAAWLHAVPRREREPAVHRVMTSMRLADRAGTPVQKLSGGMRQRALVGMALVHEPSLLVLDEPTVGLDPAEQQAFRRLLTAQGAERVVLLSTHLLDEAASVADRVVVLAGGRIRFRGTPEELMAVVPARGGEERTRRLERAYLELVEPVGAAT